MAASGASPGEAGGIGAFLIAFVLGSAGIVLCRLLLPDLLPSPDGATWISTLVAVAAILALGVHYHQRRSAGDISRSGDDLYYLGFLFTLVSLSYALVVLFMLDEGDADLADRTGELIGSFGIALLSTVAGILGRIILQGTENGGPRPPVEEPYSGYPLPWGPPRPVRRRGTHPPDPPARPERRSTFRPATPSPDPPASPEPVRRPRWWRKGGDEARRLEDLELAHSVRRLRAELRDATDAIAHYNRSTLMQAEDMQRHARRVVEDFTRELKERARSAIVESDSAYRKLGDQLHATGDGLVGRIERVTGALAPLAESVDSAARSVSGFPDDVEQARHGIGALADTARTLAGRIDEGAEGVAKAGEALARNAREHRENMERNLKSARTMGERMDSEVSAWSQSEERTRVAVRTAAEVAGALGTLIEQVESASNALTEFSERLEAARPLFDARDEALEGPADHRAAGGRLPRFDARDEVAEAFVPPANGGTSWRRVCRDALRRHLTRAEEEGKRHIVVSAESLRRELGYDASDVECMRECREIMYGEMGSADRVDTSARDGSDATLTIRYALPRRHVA